MKTKPSIFQTTLILLLYLSLPSLALAHSESGFGGGFMSGFMHPVLGWDHVAAMVAVGIWGAFLGKPAIWLLPIIFPMVMAIGGVMGVIGIPIPYIEVGIALSSLIIGLLIFLAIPTPLWLASLIVAAFAIFHGHAHGTELPNAAGLIAYSTGFVLSTGLLHLAGIAIGEVSRWDWGTNVIRATGLLIFLSGVYFLVLAV